MFSNIGNKIRVLAKVICIIGIVCSAIAGVVVMIIGFVMLGKRQTSGTGVLLIFLGIFYAGLGALFSWIGSFVLYGFGQLVHSVQNLESRICDSVPDGYYGAPVAPAPGAYMPEEKVCPSCGSVNSANSKFCEKCGQTL